MSISPLTIITSLVSPSRPAFLSASVPSWHVQTYLSVCTDILYAQPHYTLKPLMHVDHDGSLGLLLSPLDPPNTACTTLLPIRARFPVTAPSTLEDDDDTDNGLHHNRQRVAAQDCRQRRSPQLKPASRWHAAAASARRWCNREECQSLPPTHSKAQAVHHRPPRPFSYLAHYSDRRHRALPNQACSPAGRLGERLMRWPCLDPRHVLTMTLQVTASAGVMYFLAALLLCLIYRTSRANEPVTSAGDVEMASTHRRSGQSGQLPRTVCPTAANKSADRYQSARSRIRACIAGSLHPLTHFKTRGQTTGDNNGHDGLTTPNRGLMPATPLRPARPSPGAHDIPFETHPNPLASSPMFTTSPMRLPPHAATRAAKHYSRPSYSNESPISRARHESMASDDSKRMGVHSASDMDLAASYAHEVDVHVARSNSVKTIVAATARRNAS